MSGPLASIIIDNHNYARFLAEAIDSALEQAYARTEVIVVDDGSTDHSREIIERYGDRIIPVFKENGGQASAFNTGFRASRGEIVCFLDADDMFLPTAVEEVARQFGDPRAVRIHWPLWEIDEQSRRTGRLYPPHPLPEGDLSSEVLMNGPISYANSPTSGNAWRRAFLENVFPIRECGDMHGADAYLFTLSPFYGLLAKLDAPQSCYRLHSANFSGHTILSKVRRDVRRYDHHCRVLEDFLRRKGVHVDPANWKGPTTFYAWMRNLLKATEEVEALLPPDAVFILVDENQCGGRDFLPGRRILPFTEQQGEYAGPPKDDDAAIQELKRLHVNGASFIVFAWPAFWWLEHYSAFHNYLRANYRRLFENERLVAFELRRE